jgi:hypothetical protein
VRLLNIIPLCSTNIGTTATIRDSIASFELIHNYVVLVVAHKRRVNEDIAGSQQHIWYNHAQHRHKYHHTNLITTCIAYPLHSLMNIHSNRAKIIFNIDLIIPGGIDFIFVVYFIWS